ncbi:hypothetical protein T439DRAFT_353168 [Meredithblackwellia eburnea MCA 4105]
MWPQLLPNGIRVGASLLVIFVLTLTTVNASDYADQMLLGPPSLSECQNVTFTCVPGGKHCNGTGSRAYFIEHGANESCIPPNLFGLSLGAGTRFLPFSLVGNLTQGSNVTVQLPNTTSSPSPSSLSGIHFDAYWPNGTHFNYDGSSFLRGTTFTVPFPAGTFLERVSLNFTGGLYTTFQSYDVGGPGDKFPFGAGGGIDFSAPASKHSNAGAIAGGVVGGLVALLLVIVTIFLLLRRHQKRSNRDPHDTDTEDPTLEGLPESKFPPIVPAEGDQLRKAEMERHNVPDLPLHGAPPASPRLWDDSIQLRALPLSHDTPTPAAPTRAVPTSSSLAAKRTTEVQMTREEGLELVASLLAAGTPKAAREAAALAAKLPQA